jgi:hypothetical protein
VNRLSCIALSLLVAVPATALAQTPPPPGTPAPPAPPRPPRLPRAGQPVPPMPPVPPLPPTLMGGGHFDDFDDFDDWDQPQRHGQGITGGAGKPAVVAVKGPINLGLELVNGDVELVTGTKNEVSVNAQQCGADEIMVESDGQNVLVDFDESGTCQGPVKISLPAGSSVELEAVNGAMLLTGTYRVVEISLVSGRVVVDSAQDVAIETVNAGVTVKKVSGRVQIESVNGKTDVTSTSATPHVRFETTNGGLRWSGLCAAGCRLDIESFNGEVVLELDPKSSFAVRYSTQSGGLDDKLGVNPTRSSNLKGMSHVRGSYGKGEGQIQVETYNGPLRLKKR